MVLNPVKLRKSDSARAMTILLVDDERDILASYKALIEAALPGTQVLAALSASEALALLQARRVDAIVSDYRMPGMDGLEFLARVKDAAPGVPRMLFTAYADEALARKVRDQGLAEAFLSKAEHPRDFLAKVDELLKRSTSTARPT